MNAPSNPPPITADRIDQLVDGSLPIEDRRALLLALDATPDGWRRCALAFLEAQAWREAIGPLAFPGTSDRGPTRSFRRASRRLRLAPISLAAAVAMLAFVLGRATVSPDRPLAEPPQLVSTDSEVQPAPTGSSMLTPAPSTAEPDELSPPDPDSSADPGAPSGLAHEYQAIGYLSMPTTDDPDAPIAQLPVLSGPGLDDQWLRDQPPFVPEELQRQWKAHGYDVELQRRLVSVQLDDSGRYLTIPVDEVLLRAPEAVMY